MAANFFLVTLLLIFSDVSLAKYFTIIGTQTTFPGSIYRAVLTNTGYSREKLEVSLKSPTGEQIFPDENYGKPIELNKDIIRALTFRIPDNTEREKYILSAKSNSDPQVFEQDIKVIPQRYSVFIQTDKAFYKPTDTVNYRVLVLDAEMKPYQFNNMIVAFTNGEDKPAASQEFKFSERGFYESSQKFSKDLSDLEIYGKWEISVTVDRKKQTSKNFFVENYKLPQFGAFIKPSKTRYLSNELMTVKVFAKYALNQKDVPGEATMTAMVYDSKSANNFSLPVEFYRGSATINLQRHLGQLQSDKVIIKLEATFKDELTNRKATSETFVTVFSSTQRPKLEIIRGQKFLIPGQPYLLRFEMKNVDGSIAELSEQISLETRVAYFQSECRLPASKNVNLKRTVRQMVTLIKGVGEVSIDVPHNGYALVFKYDNKIEKAYRIKTQSRENLGLKLNESLQVNQTVSVQVNLSNVTSSEVYSIVIGKKGIISEQKHSIPRSRTNFDLTFEASPEMIPSSNLIVYYFQRNGEIVFDQVKLDFPGSFSYQLDISLDKNEIKPGKEVRITVDTEPNSFVGLLAVDQRSLFLKSGNDLSEAEIIDKINSFRFNSIANRREIKSSYALFGDSNAFLMTNANDGSQDCSGETNRFARNAYFDTMSKDEFDKQFLRDDPDSLAEHIEEIQETWFFKSFKVDADGHFALNKIVPDRQASYVLTGFAINPESGLSIAKPQTIEVSKKFSLELNAPHSATVGEVIKVQVLVHNFFKSSEIIIVLEKNDGFEVVESKAFCQFSQTSKTDKTVLVVAETITPVYFYIRLLKNGKYNLKAQAGNTAASQYISINPNGLQKGHNKVKFLDLRSRRYDGHYFDMDVDANAALSSVQVEASAIGDLMGPALENIEKLVDLPLGTTQQELFKYMPTTVALNYLKTIGNLNDRLKQKGIKTLEDGYNSVTSKKFNGGKNSGGYPKWKTSDANADIETTASVCKFLSVAKEWIEVDDRLITDALSFLKKKQQKGDGRFSESSLSSGVGAASEVDLTSFVVISMLENTHYIERHRTAIDKALEYISRPQHISNDAKSLAISAYALALGKHSAAEKFIDKLKEIQIIDGDIRYWKADNPSKQVEVASYAILAYVQLERQLEATDILRWLISERNPVGGFYSTEDSIVGLQAIAEMAKHLYADKFDLNVFFLYDPDQIIQTHISNKNKQTLQNFAIPTNGGVSIQANGTGVAYVQVWQTYFEKPENIMENFKINVTAKERNEVLTIHVCVNHIPRRNSGLAVVEVMLPTGYEYDESSTEAIEVNAKKVVKYHDKINIFFAQLSARPICVEVKAIPYFNGVTSLPSYVKAYAYEDKDKLAIEYYRIPSARSCN